MLKKIQTFLQRVQFPLSFTKMAESIVSLGKRPAEIDDKISQTVPKKKKKKQHVVQLGKTEGCKRKIAMMVAYNGAGYYGVQINPGFPTIESEFFPALVKIGSVPEDHATTPSKMWFQRGSRTDKGVSAVGQIFSMKAILVPDFVTKLNEILPAQIRVIGYVRTTNGFDSKNFCCARTYMYMMPTFAFAPIEKFITDDYRTSGEILEKVRAVLKRYLGTHKFHNFTSGVKFEQASASRYMISFECSEPYVRDGLEFVTLRVKGQSFMLHHIRKMIGLTIAIVRGYCGESAIDKCWGPDKVDVPKAPGLGLVLEELHFDGYNKKFGSDGVHDRIDWSQYKDTVEEFKESQIISSIVAQEKSDRVMFNWLRTLQFHSFDHPRLEGPEKPWVGVAKMLNEKKSPKKDEETGELINTNEASGSNVDGNKKTSEISPAVISTEPEHISNSKNLENNEVDSRSTVIKISSVPTDSGNSLGGDVVAKETSKDSCLVDSVSNKSDSNGNDSADTIDSNSEVKEQSVS